MFTSLVLELTKYFNTSWSELYLKLIVSSLKAIGWIFDSEILGTTVGWYRRSNEMIISGVEVEKKPFLIQFVQLDKGLYIQCERLQLLKCFFCALTSALESEYSVLCSSWMHAYIKINLLIIPTLTTQSLCKAFLIIMSYEKKETRQGQK